MNRPPDVTNFNGLLSSTQQALQADAELDENVTQAAKELRSLLNVSSFIFLDDLNLPRVRTG